MEGRFCEAVQGLFYKTLFFYRSNQLKRETKKVYKVLEISFQLIFVVHAKGESSDNFFDGDDNNYES